MSGCHRVSAFTKTSLFSFLQFLSIVPSFSFFLRLFTVFPSHSFQFRYFLFFLSFCSLHAIVNAPFLKAFLKEFSATACSSLWLCVSVAKMAHIIDAAKSVQPNTSFPTKKKKKKKNNAYSCVAMRFDESFTAAFSLIRKNHIIM